MAKAKNPAMKALASSEVQPSLNGEPVQRSPMQNVLAILKNAGEDIAAEFAGYPDHNTNALRAKSVLDRLRDQFALTSGNVHEASNQKADFAQTPQIQKEVTSIGGKPFEQRRARGAAPSDLQPTVTQARTLQERVDAATEAFVFTPTEEILKDWDQLVVRGVARKAHVPVTSNEPAVITSEWVDLVKEAVKANVKTQEGTEDGQGAESLDDLNEQE